MRPHACLSSWGSNPWPFRGGSLGILDDLSPETFGKGVSGRTMGFLFLMSFVIHTLIISRVFPTFAKGKKI